MKILDFGKNGKFLKFFSLKKKDNGFEYNVHFKNEKRKIFTKAISEYEIYNKICSLIIVLVNFVILYLGVKSSNFKGLIFFVILGGSLGNLFDRLYYSAVPDFIDLNYNDFHWFIFNVADVFITLGVVCLIFVEIIFNKVEKKTNE